LFPFVPYNTLGEDIKMLKDEGLTLILILSILMALWTASLSISEEIEGRTALTLLSKPVGRRQFIFGKFLGILVPVAVMFVILGALFLASVSYKLPYDARESALNDPTMADCQREMLQVAPGLLLGFMEAVVLTAISVAISTRLPMLANLIICAAIYVLGHLVPILANSPTVGRNAYVKFIADLQAAVFPVLEHFNISAGISTGQTVPLEYLAWAALYCIGYSCAAMLLALLLFEDRDLA
jgi:ABC-type transport system involved in multi-copper enzyme maturation permease subunit